ncbi:MAG: hypothetical protein GOU98_01235 [Candidatus Altiarchaeota archaeon]|nr:hypothetical protein [Candidatus Altiarchaeota archaeon]
MSRGSIITYIGPMHSFKTGQLFGVVDAQQYAKNIAETLGIDALFYDILIGKPTKDDRNIANDVVLLHSKSDTVSDLATDFQYFSANSLESALFGCDPKKTKILLDEAQFEVGGDLAATIRDLSEDGFEFHISLLSTNYTGYAFNEQSKDILAYSDEIIFSARAYCLNCNENNPNEPQVASKTLLKDDGKPKEFIEGPFELVGDAGFYAVCRRHHYVPGKDKVRHSNYFEIDDLDVEGTILVVNDTLGVSKDLDYSLSINDITSRLKNGEKKIILSNLENLDEKPEVYARFLDDISSKGYQVVVLGSSLDANNKPDKYLREILPMANKVITTKVGSNGNGLS